MLAKLPMEIIDKVFGYLEEKDKLNVAQLNKQLECAFAYNVRNKYKRLKTYEYTVNELKVVLPLCGSNVVDLGLSNDYKSCDEADVIFNLISKHCVNLKSASVVITPFNFHACKYVLSIKSLETIMLGFCLKDYLESDILQYISPDCKVLTVANLSKQEDGNIPQLIDLEELKIYQPHNDLEIFQMGSNFEKRRVLRLQGYRREPFQELDIEHPLLEELERFFCDIQTALPKCPKLKFLRFTIRYDENVDFIGDAIAMYTGRLEKLVLISHNIYEPQLTGKQLINALVKCKRLKRFGATIDLLTVLFDESLQSFIDLLKENGFNRERRFLMNLTSFHDLKPFWKLRDEIANSEVWNLINFTK